MTDPGRSSTGSREATAWPRFQILSLDGGGIRGLFGATLLAALEQDLRIRVVDHFDLIAGTSTGGIVAIGLGLGLTPQEVVELYVQEGPRIFSNPLGLGSLQKWYRRKYSALPLENALKSCFGERLLGESQKRLVVPAYNLGQDDVYLFRTAHHEKLRRDYRVPAWKVARATSAAPTFFSSARGIDNLRLVDGGVWANNPVMVAVAEAVATLGAKPDSIRVLSIGTSREVRASRPRLDGGGIVAWGRGNAAVDLIIHAQSVAADNQAGLLLGRDRVVRVDPAVAEGEFSLDGSRRAPELIAMASHYSRALGETFQRQLADHFAPAFEPLYRIGAGGLDADR
ncbi:MAG: patatin-like phospholipase family protein [Thermoanaerobaculia bacterium]|nr:MAG: patatin-like phospholipase family protein [Thermoanaerobaculia bacterium]MBZ0102332.1 patatin-like phospholipase family protein [Thermoanaerobaculia bacterium]